MEDKKKCSSCGLEMRVEDFYSDRSHKDGLSSHCRPCINQAQRLYYARNREYKVDYQRRYREAHPERTTEAWRRSVLKSQFGITLERYNELLEEQDHRCKICNRHTSEFTRRLAVDHCHTSGAVRALLCAACNTGLGAFSEDPERLRAAADYAGSTSPGLAMTPPTIPSTVEMAPETSGDRSTPK